MQRRPQIIVRRRPHLGAAKYRAHQTRTPTFEVQPDFVSIAESIIRGSSRERPADGVLRSELRAQRDLAPEIATQVSRGVFAYFRWRGWLEEQRPVRDQIRSALALADRYALQPAGFSDAELKARAIPGWLPGLMETPIQWVRSLQREPRLWLRAQRGQGGAVAEKLGDCTVYGEGPWSDTLEYRGKADLFRTAEFHTGQFELQDVSSQAVGLVCDPRPGEKWWDACAGEGGKTLHLAALMENKGLIWASDRAAWRLTKLKRRAARAGMFNYRSVVWQGGVRPPTKTAFDGVLLDAPCSGIGTWQRNPHARWTTTPDDVRELAQAQTQLLIAAAAGVKPGGKLFYAACTLTRVETVEVVKAFEAASAAFRRLELVNPLTPGRPPVDQLFLWPQETGGNGMFVAAWVRARE